MWCIVVCCVVCALCCALCCIVLIQGAAHEKMRTEGLCNEKVGVIQKLIFDRGDI